MNINNLKTTYDINSSCPPFRTVVSHDCDVNTRTVEVCFHQGVTPLAISKDCTAKAIFVERETNILINDNVPCTITDSGSVLIPVDNLHRQGRFDMGIEVTIANPDGNKIIATPFPMWITVNASILNNAEISEESKGTVPELLKEAAEALAEAKDYENLDNLPAINGHKLVGNKTGDSLGLQNKLTAGENITINANGEISASGGVTSYAELNNKPKVLNSNGILISQILDSLQFGSDFTVSNVEDPNKININLTRYISGSKITEKSLPLNSIVADGFARLFKYIPEYGVTRKNINDYGKYDSGDGYSQGQGCFITKITDFSYYRNVPVNSPCFLINATPFGDTYGFQAIVAYDVVNNSTVIKTRFSYNLSNSSWTMWRDITTEYTLTEQDKQDIAAIVLSELPTTQGVLYGNANN